MTAGLSAHHHFDMRTKHLRIQVLFIGDSTLPWEVWHTVMRSLDASIQHATDFQDLPATIRPDQLALTVLAGTPTYVHTQMASLSTRPDLQEAPTLIVLKAEAAADLMSQSNLGRLDWMDPNSPPELIATRMGLYLQLLRSRLALADSQQQLENELALATRIQHGFLPHALPAEERLVCARYHKTCATLGGDLHDFFSLGRGRLGVYLADVSGHGTSAALLSGLVKMSFETLKEHIDPRRMPVSELLDPGIMLMRTNAALHAGLPEDVFVTLQYAVFDPRAQYVRLSTAGHPSPILARAATGEASLLNIATGPALGPFKDALFPVSTISIFPGDKLVFYTDGLTETMNEHDEEFGIERMIDIVGRDPALEPGRLVDELIGELNSFRGDIPLADDCSLVVLKVL